MAGIRHCWEKTELLRAWEREVQVEATSRVKELFPNLPPLPQLVPAQVVDVATAVDDKAGDLGRPFTETEDEEEWLEWVDWGSTWGREHRSKAPAAPQLHERQKNTKFASVVLCV